MRTQLKTLLRRFVEAERYHRGFLIAVMPVVHWLLGWLDYRSYTLYYEAKRTSGPRRSVPEGTSRRLGWLPEAEAIEQFEGSCQRHTKPDASLAVISLAVEVWDAKKRNWKPRVIRRQDVS